MNCINRFLASAALLILITSLSAPASAALVRYTYIGNSFNSFSTTGESYIYGVDPLKLSRVSIAFTLGESQVPKNGRFEWPEIDLTNTRSPFLDFSISDGYRTIDGTQVVDPYRTIKSIGVAFDTDSEGNVSGSWHVTGKSGYYTFYDTAYFSIESAFNVSPILNYDGVKYTSTFYGFSPPDSSEQSTREFSAVINNAPGTWTRSVIPGNVPLPGGMLLFASALCGLYFNRRLFWWRG